MWLEKMLNSEPKAYILSKFLSDGLKSQIGAGLFSGVTSVIFFPSSPFHFISSISFSVLGLSIIQWSLRKLQSASLPIAVSLKLVL